MAVTVPGPPPSHKGAEHQQQTARSARIMNGLAAWPLTLHCVPNSSQPMKSHDPSSEHSGGECIYICPRSPGPRPSVSPKIGPSQASLSVSVCSQVFSLSEMFERIGGTLWFTRSMGWRKQARRDFSFKTPSFGLNQWIVYGTWSLVCCSFGSQM